MNECQTLISVFCKSVKVYGVLLLCFAGGAAYAEVKVADLTKGDKPNLHRKMKVPLSGNLGPTGLLGWVYHDRTDTSLSRQILITEVEKGSPADGIIRVGDVILGAGGSSENLKPFSSDARKSFAYAIADAEAGNPADLHLIVWRRGSVKNLKIKLLTMGAYGDNAPYDCPKSMRVIKRGLKYLETNEVTADRFALNALVMLACDVPSFPGREKRLAKAREWVTAHIPPKEAIDRMVSKEIEVGSKIAWPRTYKLIIMAEYYLATGDNPSKDGIDLLTAIDATAQSVARGQSMYGTMGHKFAQQGEDGAIHGPYSVGYGPLNATGLAAWFGLSLALECKLPNQKTNKAITEAMKRAETFFSYYAFRGAIPYGEHVPWVKSHCSNGKSGLAAAVFARTPGREKEAKYFSQYAVAAGGERSGGHGGAFFNYLWTHVGAAAGGEESAASYFKQISWHLDLARTWDGGFYYNDYGNPGYHGESFKKAGMFMSTPMLLTYALGLKKLRMTGSSSNPKTKLSQHQLEQANLASGYQPSKRSRADLLDDLGSFSAVVRIKAADALLIEHKSKPITEELGQIVAKKGHPSRLGALRVLGLIGDATSAATLVRLFSDEDVRIREESIVAFQALPVERQLPQIDTLLKMATELKRDPMKVYAKDPVNVVLVSITQLLLGKGGLIQKDLSLVKKHSSMVQFYDAFRAMATVPSSSVRQMMSHAYAHFTVEDIKALGDTIIKLIYQEAPADAMSADAIRVRSAQLLFKHRFEEVIQASLVLYKEGGNWAKIEMIKGWGRTGPLLKQHKNWPQIERIFEEVAATNEINRKGRVDKKIKNLKTFAEKSMKQINSGKLEGALLKSLKG